MKSIYLPRRVSPIGYMAYDVSMGFGKEKMNISRLKFLKFVFKLIFKLHRQEFGNVIYIYIYIY